MYDIIEVKPAVIEAVIKGKRRSPRRPNGEASPWTPAKVARLAELWSEGVSASVIAKELGCTRNAVIGKTTRLKIETPVPRGGPKTPHDKISPAVIRRIARRPIHTREPGRRWNNDAKIPQNQRKSLLDLGKRDCRWPVGDPMTEDFFFCGARVWGKQAYCRHHCNRAWLPLSLPERRAG